VIDTLDDAGVNQYVGSIAEQTGKLDIVLDASGPLAKEYGNGKTTVDLSIDEFMMPLVTMVRSRFITARAAARHMIKRRAPIRRAVQRSGPIVATPILSGLHHRYARI